MGHAAAATGGDAGRLKTPASNAGITTRTRGRSIRATRADEPWPRCPSAPTCLPDGIVTLGRCRDTTDLAAAPAQRNLDRTDPPWLASDARSAAATSGEPS